MISCQHLLHLNAYNVPTDFQFLLNSFLQSGFSLYFTAPELPVPLNLLLNLPLHLDLPLLGRRPLQLLMKAARARRLAEHRRRRQLYAQPLLR